MVVGSGIGACAAAALVGGARSVYGHDLSSDFPASVSLQNYVPPLVRLYRCPPRYAQSLETFSTSGDWFDSQVSLSLLSHCPPDGLLVLDITSDKGNSWEVLQPLLMHEWLGLCLLRIQGMRRMQAEVVGKIRAVGRVTMVVLVDEDEDFQEIVYLFLKTRVAESLPVVPMEVCDPLSPSIRNEVKTVELIVASLVAPLGCGLKGTVRETLVSVLMSFKSYLAWGTVGPSYSGWTEILAACASCEFILLYTESERLALIDHALTGGTVPLVMLDNHLIAFSDKLRYLYTKLAPRLLGYEDYVLDPL